VGFDHDPLRCSGAVAGGATGASRAAVIIAAGREAKGHGRDRTGQPPKVARSTAPHRTHLRAHARARARLKDAVS
jgi:hypothetical protein